MEVEIKLRLPSPSAHQLLSDALSPFHLRTHLHHNLFFDTHPSNSLLSRRSALRIRFYESSSHPKCVLSLKSRPTLTSGISRVEEHEESIDPSIAHSIVANPSTIKSMLKGSDIMRRVEEEIGEQEEEEEFVCLGGFRNVRGVYKWKGLVLELDETRYDFGTSYELECETGEPERVRGMLEEFLKENGVEYRYSEASKFAVFRAGKLLD